MVDYFADPPGPNTAAPAPTSGGDAMDDEIM